MIWLSEGITKSANVQNKKVTEYELPKVSIIVAARNEEEHIVNLLDSLKMQTYNKELIEIIIADDRSSDKTSNIVKSYKDEMTNLIYIRINETPMGWGHKKWALNSALEKAKGEIILQTDADCIPDKNWIKTIVNGFIDQNTGFISGPTPLTTNNDIEQFISFESNAQDAFSAGGLGHGLVFSCVGRNIAFRKNVFDEIAGYSGIEYLPSGDDDLLMHKISKLTKYNVHFIMSSEAAVFSIPPKNISELIHQRLRFASKGLLYYQRNADISLRTVLPLLYITNVIVLISLSQFTGTTAVVWLLPWIIKSSGDAVITYNYLHQLKQQWKLSQFLLLSLIHPFYMVILGGIGPFMKVKWK